MEHSIRPFYPFIHRMYVQIFCCILIQNDNVSYSSKVWL